MRSIEERMEKFDKVIYCILALTWFGLSIAATIDVSDNYRFGFILLSFFMGIEKLLDAFAPRRFWGK